MFYLIPRLGLWILLNELAPVLGLSVKELNIYGELMWLAKRALLTSELVRWRNREETTKRTTPTERHGRPGRPTPRLLVLRSEGHKCN